MTAVVVRLGVDALPVLAAPCIDMLRCPIHKRDRHALIGIRIVCTVCDLGKDICASCEAIVRARWPRGLPKGRL